MNTSGQISGSAVTALVFGLLWLWSRHRNHATGWSVMWAVCAIAALVGTATTMSVGGVFVDAIISVVGSLANKFLVAVHSVHVSK
jgi:steroid 5-alpha reductase family enzyme